METLIARIATKIFHLAEGWQYRAAYSTRVADGG
jgi:hypothetical protein